LAFIAPSIASEPNLLKIRLKQSVIERKARAGPLAARRQERLLQAAQRRLQKHHQSSLVSSMYHIDILILKQFAFAFGLNESFFFKFS
jgi:hypothetical protein